jgi:hypothetical protein
VRDKTWINYIWINYVNFQTGQPAHWRGGWKIYSFFEIKESGLYLGLFLLLDCVRGKQFSSQWNNRVANAIMLRCPVISFSPMILFYYFFS